jgi:hypothetical protein
MTITYDWRIANLEHRIEDGFVFTAHYTVNATDSTHSSGAYGSVGLERPSDLIPYESLTEEIVVGWVKEKLGAKQVTEIQQALEAQIEDQKHPKTATGVPWNG